LSIEKDIRQLRKFRNEHHKALVNLVFTHSYIKEKLQIIFNREDISMQQYNILRILRGSEHPVSTIDLRNRMLDKMSDTSRITERLLAKKLIKKSVSKTDKRLVAITITAKGKQLLVRLDEFNREIDRITSGLTVEEAALLNTLLDKIRKLP
jgi:DNA-binding MarR family transcriptional regulator